MFPIPSYEISATGVLFLLFGIIGAISTGGVGWVKWKEREDVPFDTVFIQRKSVEGTPVWYLGISLLVSITFVLFGAFLVIGGGVM